MQNKIYKIICCIIISCFYCTLVQAADNVYTQSINIGNDDTEYNPVPIEIIEPAEKEPENKEFINNNNIPIYTPYPYYVPQPYYYPVLYYNNPHYHGGIYYPSTGINVHTHFGSGYDFRAANWKYKHKPINPPGNKRPKPNVNPPSSNMKQPGRPHHPNKPPRQ